MDNNIKLPEVFFIEGKNMVQLPSTPKSGNYKFKDLKDGEIYLYEWNEIPKHYQKLIIKN